MEGIHIGWLGDLLGGAVGLIPGVGPTAQKLIGAGIGAAGAIAGASKGAQADKLNKQQLQMATDRYNAGAPFRSRLAQQAFSIPTQAQDLSSIFADKGNPYSRTAPPQAAAPLSPLAQSGLAEVQQTQTANQRLKDQAEAAHLHDVRQVRSGRYGNGAPIGDALAEQELQRYMAANPNSQWAPGGPNALTTATPQAPVPGGTPGFGGLAQRLGISVAPGGGGAIPQGGVGGALTGGIFGGGGPRVPLSRLLASGNGKGLTGLFQRNG